MGKTLTSWKKGDPSPNPNGRPLKHRALTAILERAGSKTVDDDGKSTSRRRVLARMVWEAATTGSVRFPDGKALKVDAGDWFDVVKWIYSHIDGPPKQQIGLTGVEDGPPITFIEVIRPAPKDSGE